MVFLVAAVMFLVNNLAAFLVFVSFIEGYMLIASTNDIITPSLLNYNSPSLSFRSDA